MLYSFSLFHLHVYSEAIIETILVEIDLFPSNKALKHQSFLQL